MNLPTLQEKIEGLARRRLIAEIDKLSNLIKYESKLKNIIAGVQVEIKNGEGNLYPYLTQIFDCEPIRKAIIEKQLPKYVENEIKNLLTESDED